MVSGLIQQEDVGLEQHRSGKSELHLPTTGQAGDRLGLTLITETDRGKGGNGLLPGALDTLVGDDELENGGVLLASVDVVLNVEGAYLIGGREAFDLTVTSMSVYR
jgi:hypothetical protein